MTTEDFILTEEEMQKLAQITRIDAPYRFSSHSSLLESYLNWFREKVAYLSLTSDFNYTWTVTVGNLNADKVVLYDGHGELDIAVYKSILAFHERFGDGKEWMYVGLGEGK